MTDQGAVLKDICDEILRDEAFDPEAGKTHCNQAARRVAQAMGCHDFDDETLLADMMCDVMASGSRWSSVSGSDATIHALGGGLAFAAMASHRLGEAHGHIAAIYPVGMGYSGSFKKDVPYCANVGKRNNLEKVSAAFPVAKGEPDYFTWK